MTSVDDKVLAIHFDNDEFEARLSDTIKSLDDLTKALEMTGARDGLTEISDAAGNVDLSGIADGVDNISSKFSALGAIAFSIFDNITNFAFDMARKLGGDIFGPILSGGKQRALNIEQAKFQFRGLGIDVEEGMQSALNAVLGTAFGLDEAAKAASQFAASGVEVGDKMTTALRGIAGVAAMTNSSFTEIAQIFTGAAGAGKVTNQDFLQFATRGLNAAAAVAKQLGTTEEQVHQMAREGKLDFETFATAMDAAFGEHATQANETYQGALSNLRAAMSRLGASFFGDKLTQERDLFNALTPVVDKVNKALQPLIQQFLALERVGIDKVIGVLNNLNLDTLTASMPNLARVLSDIFGMLTFIGNIAKTAFRDIFPKSEFSILRDGSSLLMNFVAQLTRIGDFMPQIKSVFKGFFSILDIGFAVVKGVVGLIVDLIKAIVPVGGGFLNLAASAGDMATALDNALVKGGKIQDFFANIGTYISTAVGFIREIISSFKDFFDGVNAPSGFPAIEVGVNRVSQRLENLISIPDRVSNAWDKLQERFSGVFLVLDLILEGIKQWFSELGSKIADAFKPGDFDSAVDVVNVGLLGGIALLLKKFIDGDILKNFGGGIVEQIRSALGELTNTLKTMQTSIKADAILKIAEAVGILTASLVVLSLIDSKALTKALGALTVGFAQLIGAMTLLDKINFNASAAKLAGISAGMILMATAVTVLSAAITVLSKLDLGSLVKGLIGVGVGLGLLVAATHLISADAIGLVTAGVAMITISTGLLVLSKAVASFADISWQDMAKGLIGVAIGLGILVLAMNSMPPSSVLSGLGFIAVATGLNILALAVAEFAKISWQDMAKGLVGIAGGLVAVAIGMNLMPLSLPITAAGVLVLSGALLIMAKAVGIMGALDLGTLAKGIGGFAAMLLILSAAMLAMSAAEGGAVSLLVVAGAMAILSKVLTDLSKLSFGDLLHGLVAMAAVLALLAGAALLLAPITPELVAFGVALGIIGGAFLLFGAGAILVSKAIETFAKSGVEGMKAFVEALKTLLTALPELISTLVQSLEKSISEMIKGLPLLTRLIEAVVLQLVETIVKFSPELGKALTAMVRAALAVVRDVFPDFIETGYQVVIAFLNGITTHIQDVIDAGTNAILSFVAGIIQNMPELVTAGVDLIISFLAELANHAEELSAAGLGVLAAFLQGMADNIGLVTQAATNLIIQFMAGITSGILQIVDAGAQMILALVQGILGNISVVVVGVTQIVETFITTMLQNGSQFVQSGFDALVTFLTGIGNNLIEVTNQVGDIIATLITAVGNKATDIADAGANALVNFLDGFGRDVTAIINKGTEVMLKILEGAATKTVEFVNKVGDILVNFLNALADAIDSHADDLRNAGIRIVGAIIDGMTGGLASKAGDVASGLKDIAQNALGGLGDVLGIGGPSTVLCDIGKTMAASLALGITNSKEPAKATDALSKNVISNLQEALAVVPDALADLDAFNPTITPVLDLSKVHKDAAKIDRFLNVATVNTDLSLNNARAIQIAAQERNLQISASTGREISKEIKFEQNIYAPTELSTNSIYRNTKSQIALAKEELGIS